MRLEMEGALDPMLRSDPIPSKSIDVYVPSLVPQGIPPEPFIFSGVGIPPPVRFADPTDIEHVVF